MLAVYCLLHLIVPYLNPIEFTLQAFIATSLFNEFWKFSLLVSGCNRDLLPVDNCCFGCTLVALVWFPFTKKPRKAKAKAEAKAPKAKAAKVKAEESEEQTEKKAKAKAAKVKAEGSEEKTEKKAKAKAAKVKAEESEEKTEKKAKAKAAKVKAEESEAKKTVAKAPKWLDKMLTILLMAEILHHLGSMKPCK